MPATLEEETERLDEAIARLLSKIEEYRDAVIEIADAPNTRDAAETIDEITEDLNEYIVPE